VKGPRLTISAYDAWASAGSSLNDEYSENLLLGATCLALHMHCLAGSLSKDRRQPSMALEEIEVGFVQ